MSAPVIRIENLSKHYRLGVIGGGTLREDLNRWWARVRGRPDPLTPVDARDHGNREGNQIWALRNINLEVQQGEVLGLIGRNGAGKSTLLKILSRITAPTEGRALIKGRVASLLEVGTGMHPELTGRENIYLNGTILGMTRAEVTRKLDEIIEFAEISEFIDTPVKRYSSGMRVRLAFAVAAHLEPEILIVDEVLAVGDAAFQKKCLGKMQDVSRHGRTVLFVSHNMVSVQSLCSKGVVFENGKLKTYGDIGHCIKYYLECNENAKSTFSRKEKHKNITQTLLINNIKTLNKYREPASVFLSGDELVFSIEYSAIKDLKKIRIGISIYESEGYVLINMNNIDIGKQSHNVPETGAFEFYIDSLPLKAGRYFYNVKCTVGMDTLEWIKQAGFFDVENSDRYGSGKLTEQGKFVVDYDFNVTQKKWK